jgi:eukaryotic-like serine/threonine-protein kinase
MDRTGIVRAASNESLVGKPYQAPTGQTPDARTDGVKMWRSVSAGAGPGKKGAAAGEPVLGFEAPMTFANKNVGRVVLGLPEAPLTQVARLSMLLMAVLVVVTVLAVSVAMYFVANWFAQPIKLVADAMAQIAKGRLDHRINEQRKDEFGQLYAAFDHMAQSLKDGADGAAAQAVLTPAPAADPGATPLPSAS